MLLALDVDPYVNTITPHKPWEQQEATLPWRNIQVWQGREKRWLGEFSFRLACVPPASTSPPARKIKHVRKCSHWKTDEGCCQLILCVAVGQFFSSLLMDNSFSNICQKTSKDSPGNRKTIDTQERMTWGVKGGNCSCTPLFTSSLFDAVTWGKWPISECKPKKNYFRCADKALVPHCTCNRLKSLKKAAKSSWSAVSCLERRASLLQRHTFCLSRIFMA